MITILYFLFIEFIVMLMCNLQTVLQYISCQ